MSVFNIIIPVYNEEARIAKTCKFIIRFLRENSDIYKVIFVDDGSVDGTVEVINDFIKTNSGIEVLKQDRNYGKGAAVKAGIMHAEGEYACYIDGDMAYSFNHLKKMYKALKDNDVVIGSRALGFKNSRRITIKRRLLGGGFNQLVRLITGLPYKDTQAGLKGFKLEKAKKIFSKIHDSRFWFDVEVLFIAKKYHYKIKEIPAIVAREHTGKNTRVQLFSDTLKMFWGLFKIHFYNIRGDYSQSND
ncbi:MAG: glycosyltransferase [Victivallales bacterium]|nr:glycosyltransferase [Victivallales bacterium]